MKKLAGGSPLLLLALAAGLLTLLTSSLILAWPVAAQNNDAADLAPANLTAAVADEALTLNWEAPASDDGSVTGYRILRRRPRQGEDTLQTLLADTGTPATAYADYSATEGGVRYVYRVQALRGEDASAHSNFVAFDLSDDLTNVGPERAPSNLTAAVKQGALTLRWDAPAQHAESVTGYQVLRRRPLEGEKDLLLVDRDTGDDATSWVDYDATQGGVSYVYRVKALRDGAVSHRSNFTKITLEEDLDPQPPPESAGQKSDPPIAPLAATELSLKTTGPTTAGATVTVDAAGTVYLRFAPTGTTDWSTTLEETAAGAGDVQFELTGLDPNATYDVQTSQSDTFPSTDLQEAKFTNRPLDEDFETLHTSNTEASGLWGNNTTLFVGQYSTQTYTKAKLYQYNRSTEVNESTTTLDTISGLDATSMPRGIWSDGTYLWMVARSSKVEAIALADSSYAAGQSFDATGGSKNYGIWGNSSTIWVSFSSGTLSNLTAYRKDAKALDAGKDIEPHDDNGDPEGIWSDGTTMWVIDGQDFRVYAYGLDGGVRDEDLEFDLDPDSESPRGMWSDGDTVWVSDNDESKIFAYYLPGGGEEPRVSDVGAVSASRETATATVKLLNLGSASTTVYLRYRLTADTDWTDADAPVDTTGTSATFSLSGLTANASYDLQASLDSAFMDGAEISGGFTNRPAHEDYNTLHNRNVRAYGVWGNNTNLFVGQYSANTFGGLFEYNRSSHAFESSTTLRSISGLEAANGIPQGIWSDGTYLWMVDNDGSVEALALSDDSHAAAQSFDTGVTSGTHGIWGNSSTIWVSYTSATEGDDALWAYRKDTKAADADKDIDLHADNLSPRGIWSDGTTIWVIDVVDLKAYAYGVNDGTRDEDLEFDVDPGNQVPEGMWSDGDTVWVSNHGGDRLYAYYLPVAGLGVTDVSAVSASRETATATVQLLNPESASATVSLRYKLTADTNWTDASESVDTTGTSANFSLSGLTANASYDLQASLDSAFMDGTEISGGFTNRPAHEDFDSLHSDNDVPWGLWGTADTLYVGQYEGSTIGDIMAYNRSSKAHAATISLSSISGLENTSHAPQGLWSDGTHLWMVSYDGVAEAILLSDNTHVPGQTITNVLSSTQTYGIWGNDSTIWISEQWDINLRAFAKATKAADTTKDIDLDPDGTILISSPRGIWSDGATVWVLASGDSNAYAYTISSKARDTDKEFDLDPGNTTPRGIWSDGATVWVSDPGNDKLYAYYLPVSEPRVTGVSVDTATVTKSSATVQVTLNNPDSDSQTVYQRHWAKSGSPPASASDQKTTTMDSVTFDLTGLSQGVEYQVDASLDSTFVTGVVSHTFTTLDVAGKPTGVTVTKDDKKLTVAWTAPTDTGGTAITGYKVQWKSGNQSFGSSREQTAGAADTSDDITGLTNGTEYTVRVLATNSVGDGAWSDEKKGTPSTVPGKPVVTPSGGNTEINVSWTIDTGGSAITGYTLQYKESSVAGWAAADVTEVNPANDQTSYKIENLTNGTAYTVRLQATNANGTGVWSDEEESTPVAGPSVTDVDTEDLAKTTAKVVVTIANPQATSETVAMRYKKTADANWNPTRTLTTSDTEATFNLTGLTVRTEYQAQASLDSTFATGVVSHTFTTLDVAGKPTGVTVTKDDKKLTVAWTAPTDTGGTAITGYKVQWKSGNQSFGSSREQTAGAADTSDDITGLTNGTEYTVRVLATNSVGDGAWSDEKKGTPSTVPGKPVVNVSAGNGLLQVRWTVDDGGAAIDQHTVQWKSGSQSFGGDPLRQHTTAAKEYTIPSLTNHTEYDVRVRAHNDNGDGAWSDVKSETPTPKPPPSVTIATEESEPIQGPFTFTVTFNEEVEDFHCYEDEPENPPDGPLCEIGAGYVGGALVDVKDFQEVGVNPAGEHVFSARVEDILTGTLAIFVNEGKAHAKAGGLGNTFGTLQVEVERPVLPDTPGVHFWSSTMTPAAIGGYLGYGSVGSQTGGSLNDDEFDWPRQGQIYTVKALLYNPAQGEVMLDLSHALPNRGERMILAVDGKWVSESNPEQFGVYEGGEALWTYHWHPADPGFEVGQSVDVRLSRQAPNILVTREYAAMSWDDPQDDSITGYRIERRDRDQGGGFRTLMADTGSADTSYTDRSVEPGGRYAYQVTAMNDYGESDPSGPVEADIPGGPPDRPTGLGATATEEAVTLSWDDPEDDSITGYRIERQDRDGSDGFTTLVADTGSADTGYTDDTVEAGGRYAYRVTASNGDGESQASEPANADVPGGNPPDQPTGLGAVATGDAVALTWNNSKDDTITGYRIWRRNRDTDPPSQFSVQVDNTHSDATMYTDRNVEPDTRYAYRIAAINAWGESQWSKVARVRTPPAPTRRDG